MDKHLKTVREATWDVRAKWCDLGVELGITMGTLEVGHCFIALSPTLCVVVGTGTADRTDLFVYRQLNVTATTLETALHICWRNGSPELALPGRGLPSLKLSSHQLLDVKILLGTLKLLSHPQLGCWED